MPKDQAGLVALLLRFLPLSHAAFSHEGFYWSDLLSDAVQGFGVQGGEGSNPHPEQTLRCAIPSQGPGHRDSLQGHAWSTQQLQGHPHLLSHCHCG